MKFSGIVLITMYKRTKKGFFETRILNSSSNRDIEVHDGNSKFYFYLLIVAIVIIYVLIYYV